MGKKTSHASFCLLFILVMATVDVLGIVPSVPAITENRPADDTLTALKIGVMLTPAEKSWLQEHKTIKIAGPRSFPPFHYYDEDGTLKGMSADYVRLILESLGVRMEIQKDLPWPEVLRRAQNREIDLISCSAITVDREAYLSFSQPYLSSPLVIIGRKDAPFIGGLEDLHGKKVAVIKRVSTYEWLKRDNIDIVPHIVNSPLQALEAVSYGFADAHIGNLAASSYLIQKNGLTNTKIAAPTPYGNYNLHMAVRKDWPQLVGIINKALDAMTPAQHSTIRNRWLSVRYEYGIQTVDILKWVLLVVLVAITILAIFLIWNRRLQREIAERKQAEKISQENWERYTALFERSLDAVFISDFDGKFLDANPAALDLLGYSRDEITSVGFGTLVADEQLTVATGLLTEIHETGVQKKSREFKLKTKKGRYVWVESLGSLLYKNGHASAIQGVARDISERKQAEGEREKLITELREALDNIKTLSGLLPICANCKKIRDDKGYWNQIETYIEKHSEALFSHSVCPECSDVLYGDTTWYKKIKGEGKS